MYLYRVQVGASTCVCVYAMTVHVCASVFRVKYALASLATHVIVTCGRTDPLFSVGDNVLLRLQSDDY